MIFIGGSKNNQVSAGDFVSSGTSLQNPSTFKIRYIINKLYCRWIFFISIGLAIRLNSDRFVLSTFDFSTFVGYFYKRRSNDRTMLFLTLGEKRISLWSLDCYPGLVRTVQRHGAVDKSP